MFFESGGNVTATHEGPKDLGSLMEFVNEKTGRGPPAIKVSRYLI